MEVLRVEAGAVSMTVSDELRSVERHIDDAYRTNQLLSLPRSQAMWYLMAECEEWIFRRIARGEPLDAAYVDAVINLARWPLRWLWKECDPKGDCRPPPSGPDDYYESANALARLGRDYEWFEAAFTYASVSRISLELDGVRIAPRWMCREHVRYDAYDRLRDTTEKSTEADKRTATHRIAEIVSSTVRLSGTFEYALNPNLFNKVSDASASLLNEQFRLPGDWQLPTANLSQYSTILKAFWVLSAIHFFARVATPNKGYTPAGYSRSLVIMTRDELVARLRRYLGMDLNIIRSVVEELSFGGQGIRNPDIALQPLVPLEPQRFGWAPSLVLNSSLERNLLTLLNRLPRSRVPYSKLSGRRESMMLERIRRAVLPLGFRCWSGNVAGWGGAREVDLAVIDHQYKCCLLLELKAFIAPADPREVVDKSVEIEKGVEQVNRRRDALCQNRSALNDELDVDDDFTVHFAVVSESAVGCGMADLGDTTVVRISHLIECMKSQRNLRLVCDWLEKRRFLPTPGRDYEEREFPVTILEWTLDWYQIKPLTQN